MAIIIIVRKTKKKHSSKHAKIYFEQALIHFRLVFLFLFQLSKVKTLYKYKNAS